MKEMTTISVEELKELSRDANRYRSLRTLSWWDSEYCLVHNPIENVKLGTDCPSDARMDQIADALIEAQQNEQ